MEKTKNIKFKLAGVGKVKNNPAESYLFTENLNDLNGSITMFLIKLITKEELKEVPNYEKIKELQNELDQYPKKIDLDFVFDTKEEADAFLEPLFKREKELMELL